MTHSPLNVRGQHLSAEGDGPVSGNNGMALNRDLLKDYPGGESPLSTPL